MTAVAALAPANFPPKLLNFQTLIADFDKRGVPRIRRIDYANNAHSAGPLNIVLPDFDATDVTSENCRSISAEAKASPVPFQYCFAGVDGMAKRIIEGNYESTDSAIQRYGRRLKDKTLYKTPLSEMKELANSILRETNQWARADAREGDLRQIISVVGGRDQICVYPRKGRPRCYGQENLPTDEQLLPLKFVRAGFLYDRSNDAVPVNPIGISFFWGGHHDPDERIRQVFIGNHFRNVTVRLDGNYFVKNGFDSVTFRYGGGECFLPPPPHWNGLRACRAAMPPNMRIPQSCMAVASCEPLPQLSSQDDGPEVVGAPLRMRSTGCRRMNADGTITYYIGGECGNFASSEGPLIK